MHILLVEDSHDDASLLNEFLAEEPNAPEMHWVADGREALDFVYQTGKYRYAPRPDVILLDLALPRFSGYEALKELKLNPFYSQIPVIVITTSYNPADRSNCMMLGADAYFSKPSNLQGYEDLVQQLMNTEFPRVMQVEARAPAQNA